MQTLTLSVPHQLGRAEARRRIELQISQQRAQHGHLIQNLREEWHGDTLEFSLRAMGQEVSGRLFVEDQVVRLEVPLPWPITMIAGSFKPMIEQEGRKLLAGPSVG